MTSFRSEIMPDDLRTIRRLRPPGPRMLELGLSEAELQDRILGALLGRAAGCVLGVPCEGMSREQIADAARRAGQDYPLTSYWTTDPHPGGGPALHYDRTPRERFLRPNLEYIGADDDIVYTVLGVLIAEQWGLDFTSEDVGQAWLKYLPMACTAEAVALENLRKGLKPPQTATTGNPYFDWIGAAIRSDPWGYIAPGAPELAAELAHRDAVVSHTGEGIYGEMFWAATIAAAFTVSDVREAIRIGVSEIPSKSELARAVNDTLRWCERDADWEGTLDRILVVYEGMSPVHTINNAAVTLAGLIYGDGNFEKAIALTVMGGLDTDCTGATAGSVMGAMLGAKALPAKWIAPLDDRIETYLLPDNPDFAPTDLAARFTKLALELRGRVGK